MAIRVIRLIVVVRDEVSGPSWMAGDGCLDCWWLGCSVQYHVNFTFSITNQSSGLHFLLCFVIWRVEYIQGKKYLPLAFRVGR